MKLQATGNDLLIVESERLISGSINMYTCEFTFDESWDGYTVTAVFSNSGSRLINMAVVDGKCDIPHEVLRPNARIRVGIFGIDGERSRPTTYSDWITVEQGTDSSGSASQPPTPTVYEQWMDALEDKHDEWDEQEQARAAAEAERVVADQAREAAEAARVEAEQAREDLETGYVAQAEAAAAEAAAAQKMAEDARDEVLSLADGVGASIEYVDRKAAETESKANTYTDEQIAAIPTPDVSGQIGAHNADTGAHADIREALANKADADRVVNPNLLDNAYFGNPVDQRGGWLIPAGTQYFHDTALTKAAGTTTAAYAAAQYVNETYGQITLSSGGIRYVSRSSMVRGYTGAGYTIDRWKFAADGGVARKTDGGIFLGCIHQSYAYVNHSLEISRRNSLNGKVCTLSALTVDGDLRTVSGVWGVDALIANLGGENLLYNNPGDAGVNLRVDATGVTLAAAKLELGSQQTLAHQENGVWVLNEIPDYNEQLLRCCMSTADSADAYANNKKTAEVVGAVAWPQEIVSSGSIKDWALAQTTPTSAAVSNTVTDMPVTGGYWFIRFDVEADHTWRKITATNVRSNDTYILQHVNGTWGDWAKFAFASEVLPLTGGTLSGNLSISKSIPGVTLSDKDSGAGGSVFVTSDRLYLQNANVSGANENRRQLIVCNSDAVQIANALVINDVVNGTSTVYNVLHQGNAASLGYSRIVTGTYSGAGKYGSSNANTLTPGWAPKAMMIYPLGTSTYGVFAAFFVKGQKGKVFYGRTMQERFEAVDSWTMTGTTWGTTNVSWYSDAVGSQMNESGVSYGYIIWG